MTECPGCGGPLGDDEPACPACGLSVGGPTPVEEPRPGLEDPAAEGVPSVAAADEESGKPCPACGGLNPVEAQFCVQCRHSFNERATFFGIHWLVVPAILGIVFVVAAAMVFSGGLAGGGDVATTPEGGAARAGADDVAQQALNQTRNVSARNATTPEVVGARNYTPTPNVTPLTATPPTRTVDPNATPWNAQIGAGIYHTEGGTHYVGLSPELQLKRRVAAATLTPGPAGFGEGSGHATGPLSWVGTGNWSPGVIDLPAGDAQVVLLSQGTTAFILADEADNRAGFGVFPPPGGQYIVPVSQTGRYVIAFGTANRTDSWSATVLLPGAGGQVAAPPVPTPNTQLLTFTGTGGGSPGSFNLTPGTVHVQLWADEMTMAYIKDSWGVTLSTTVAGPNPGGSTVAIPKTGTYRLEIWGTGTWSATVTWTGTSSSTALVPATNVTTGPSIVPTTATGQIAFAGTGSSMTAPFHLDAMLTRFHYTHAGTGHFSIALQSKEGQYIDLIEDDTGELTGEQVLSIERPGDYVLTIGADPGAGWTVSVS